MNFIDGQVLDNGHNFVGADTCSWVIDGEEDERTLIFQNSLDRACLIVKNHGVSHVAAGDFATEDSNLAIVQWHNDRVGTCREWTLGWYRDLDPLSNIREAKLLNPISERECICVLSLCFPAKNVDILPQAAATST